MIISNITIANIPYIVDVKPGIAGSLSFPGGNSGTNMLVLNPGFTPGAGSYTVEGWIRLPNFTCAYGIVGATATNGLSLFVTNSTTFTTDKYGGGGSFSYTVPTMSANTWYYFALVRSSTTETLFLGTTPGGTATRSSSGTFTNSLNYSVSTPQIGSYYGQCWPGYMTNLRVVAGTAVYNPSSASITVPSGPLTAISGTQYLMLGASTTTDTSSYNTVTVTGTVTQTSVTKPF
jgi:hypothetical protein